jgi:hypothetical protein
VLGAVAGAGVLAVAGGLFTISGAGGSPSTQPTQSSQSVPAGGSAAPAAAVDALTKTIMLAQQMLVSRPQDYATWAALGLGYVQQAKATVDPSYYGKAEGAVARSLALNSTGNFSGWGARAALKAAEHDFRGARAAALRGISIDGYDSELYGALADADTQLGAYDQAAAAVQRMNQLRPGVAAFTRASYVFELRGQVPRARSALVMALQDSPDPADIAFAQDYLGELALNYGGDARAALQHFHAGLQADPRDFASLAGQAKAEAALGQLGRALVDYRAVVSAVPQPQYVLELGELEQSQHNPDAARQYTLFRTEEQLFTANGVTLDTEPTLFEADHGDPAAALRYAAAGWRVRPFLEMADAYSWAEYVNGHYPAALGWADKAAGTGWRNALFLFHRGMIEKALGRSAAASTDLHTALTLNPHFNPLQTPVAQHALTALQ